MMPEMGPQTDVFRLFFHSPCFDGAASAALSLEYLEQTAGLKSVQLIGVNYDLKDEWLSMPMPSHFGIVDFLYHPGVELWADHHPTTFLTEEARADFETRKSPALMYDKNASSCAILLWSRWKETLQHRKELYEELVRWADMIDSARYPSVVEAITLPTPALKINLALAVSKNKDLSQKLVAWFRTRTLEEISAFPDILTPFQEGLSLQERGLEKLKESVRLTDENIVVFDLDATDLLVNRYAPFYFYPNARYSAGITRGREDARLTTMRNPWREFASAPLGQFCATLGGGGHQRVGSIMLKGPKVSEANHTLQTLLDKIANWEKEQS